MCNVACITQYMDMALLRTAFRTIIQSSKATKWVRKETLLVNLWDSSKKERTDQSAYQVFDSQQSRCRCRCRCRWVLSIFLVKIKLPSLIFTAMEKLGREKQLYQGGKQQSKERRGPLSIHSGATCIMSSGIKDCKLLMLIPIKTPAPQAGMLRKETWES